jgi:hypothetical protein
MRGRSSVGRERSVVARKVVGSIPTVPTIDDWCVGIPMRDDLDNCTIGHLRLIALNYGLNPPRGQSKDDLINIIRERI